MNLIKETLRTEIKRRLQSLPQEQFKTAGQGALNLVRDLPPWKRCRTLLCFLSLSDEIDTSPLIIAAFAEGKRVFAPRLIPAGSGDRRIRYSPLRSPEGPWETGPQGIREPVDPPEEPEFPVLALVPGLAFDRQGNRLGRGKGYYDRLFAELEAQGRTAYRVGLCMEIQITDLQRAPLQEPWDKPVNAVCTGKELFVIVTEE